MEFTFENPGLKVGQRLPVFRKAIRLGGGIPQHAGELCGR